MRRAVRGARAALVLAFALASVTCNLGDALRPSGLENIALALVSDTVLVVGAPVLPTVTVTVNGSPYARAHVALSSSDTTLVAVHGDTLVPRRRGTVTLSASLESSALPSERPGVAARLLVVADTVTLDSASVRFASVGDTLTLTATARDAAGEAISGVTVLWSSSDTAVVAVTPAGRLAARANGTAVVRAAVDRDTAAAAVTVAQVLARWTFEPPAVKLDALTATDTVVATGHDARGNVITGAAPSAWSIGDATLVSVSTAGVVTALLNGATVLVAEGGGGVRDTVPVTIAQRATQLSIAPDPVPAVTSLGAQLQLTARAFDRKQVEIRGASPVWFTPDPDKIRVSSDGLVTTLATGQARVIATLDAAADTVTVPSSNDPATLVVAPDSALATSVGDTLVFMATARNARGDPVAATVTWRTPDSAVAAVLADGRAIALAVGTARVIATTGGKADTGLARVTDVPVAIAIAPAARTYTSLGDVDTLPVVITNARGATLPRGSVSWSSDDATIARVTTGGVVTARDTGQTVVRATSSAVTDSVLVTVLNLPATIAFLNPRTADTLTAIGQTFTLETDVRNARGDQILGYPIAWHSTNRFVVDTVLPTGVVLAIGWGATSVVAQAGPVADTMVLVVQNPTRLYVNNAVVTALRVGTASRPFAKIQDGVNAADAGDTVVVMRGTGSYSESVALARRVTILGDSAAFVGSARTDVASLPLLAHDTGAAAITAYTTAPVAVKYLVIRHTLDGPAFAGDGSDAQLRWVYVNPPSSGVTTRIGRGILVANSQAGSVLQNVTVRNVRGYGISLVNSSTANIASDSVVGVDSIGVPEGGAGISLRGGASNSVSGNVIRATRGPRILVRGAASADVFAHAFSGRHPLMQLDSVTGLVNIHDNTFQLGYDGGDWADSPDCSTDTRCAGVLITDSHDGALVEGSPGEYLWYASPADIHGNQFYNGNYYGGSPGDGIGIRLRRSEAFGQSNTFRFIQVATQLEGASKGVFYSATVDTTAWASYLYDADTLFLASVDGHEAGMIYKSTTVSTGVPWIVCLMCRFSLRRGNIINVMDDQAYISLQQSYFTSAPNAQPITFWGHTLFLYHDTVSATGDSVTGGYRAGVSYTGAVAALFTTNVWIQYSLVQGYTSFPGVLFYAGSASLSPSFTQTVLTRNRVGLFISPTVPPNSFSSAEGVAVFDNLVGGLEDGRSSGSSGSNWWWGDARGPRGGGNPAATGDSVLAAPTAPYNPLTAPPFTGTVGAELRHVRGDGQSAVAGATLPKALTVRVVDAFGLPVPGASVTFTVTAGGGNLAGQAVRTLAANGDGLAETPFTLGGVAGANIVEVTAAGLNTVVLSATGT